MSAPEPVEVYSLAQYLAEEMDERGWTAMHVGIRMGGKSKDEMSMDIFVVDMLLAVQGSPSENVRIGPDLYRKLERAFGVSDGFFERLNAGWLKYPDRRVKFDAPDDLFSGTLTVTRPAP